MTKSAGGGGCNTGKTTKKALYHQSNILSATVPSSVPLYITSGHSDSTETGELEFSKFNNRNIFEEKI